MQDNPVTKVIVPTNTFFDSKGHIDIKANQLLIHHILQNNPHCLFLMGSTGEGLYFRDKPNEKKQYLELVKETLAPLRIARDLPIIIGIYGENSEEAIQDAKLSLDSYPGASLVLPPPTQIKLNDTEQLAFFSGVIEQVSVPVYIYNNPNTFGGTNISVEVVKSLIKYPNFKGIKDSSAALEQKREYLQVLSNKVTVSCGKEGMLADFLKIVPVPQRPLVGIVPSISNIVNTCARIFELGMAGKDQEMLNLQTYMNEFREKIYDSAMEKGKAQRGTKIAFAYLYKNKPFIIPTTVRPEFKREIPIENITAIEKTTEKILKEGHIKLAE